MDKQIGPRRAGTRVKNICINDDARAAIQAWADQNGTTFSAAIETLALLGLGQSPATAMLAMVVSVVRRAVHGQMDRYGKLAAIAAIQSGMAANVSRASLRLAVQNRARARPQDFADTIFVSNDDDPAEEAYRRICRNARLDVAQRLRDPMEALLTAPGSSSDDGDEDAGENEDE
jgi:hypothetical protein